MTELVVVRHGQASFGAENYDELSALGREQSRALGEWLAEAGNAPFDVVLTGTLVRHRDTLAELAAVLAARGAPLPEPSVLPGLDEFDHRAVFGAYARRHADHPDVRAAAGGLSRDAHAMYRFLREGLVAWVEGRLDGDVPEAWPAFRARIAAAAQQLATRTAGARRALVVTSGGVMSQLAQLALELPDARAVELNLTIRNSAVAEFHHSDGALRLASWNTLPHLAAPSRRGLWTYY